MNQSITIIGGSDGPTSIFLAGKAGANWLNLFGLILVVFLLIPNIIYAVSEKNRENGCKRKFMNILEKIGCFGCLILMIFNVGLAEFRFLSVGDFIIYLIGNILFIISYWIIWMLYFMKKTFWKQIALMIIPTAVFLLCGITMRHYLLIVFAVVFGIGHGYVTVKNRAGIDE